MESIDNEEFTDDTLEQEGETKRKAMMSDRKEALVARIRRLGTFTEKDVPEVLLENERKLIAISILEVDAKDIVPAMKEALE
jgi:hypothetical protein